MKLFKVSQFSLGATATAIVCAEAPEEAVRLFKEKDLNYFHSAKEPKVEELLLLGAAGIVVSYYEGGY